MDAGLQALFWFLLKKRTRNSRLTARAILQRRSSKKMYRIRRKTKFTVLLLIALVSHFTVERSFWQIPRTSTWFDLTYSTYSDDQWYASFRVSKNTFQFLLLTRMWRTLNNWRGAPRAHKKRNRTVPKKGRAFTRWKENENLGTEPFFIGSVPKGVHSRLWTFLGTERIQLERVKYRLHVEFCRSRSSFYLGRSNFFGRVNGPLKKNPAVQALNWSWPQNESQKGPEVLLSWSEMTLLSWIELCYQIHKINDLSRWLCANWKICKINDFSRWPYES